MSEYQYVGFRAIDAPVSERNLAYMQAQSSRAEITSRSFDNEYHYGGFGGNSMEMLQRGYDLHLHYANFGTRTLLIRLPQGLPSSKAAKPYLNDSLRFVKDKHAKAGILLIEPCYEPDALEQLWDLPDQVERLVPLRAEIIAGDLRPLYLAHLAISLDDNHDPTETIEAPVPTGLSELSPAQVALADLYGIDEHLLAAAGRNSPALPPRGDTRKQYADWLRTLPGDSKDGWLVELMAEPNATVRQSILAGFQKSSGNSLWPTCASNRTIEDLRATANEIEQESDRQKAQKTARERAKKLTKLAADPRTTFLKTEQLVKDRSTHAYREIARLLADAREALAASPQAGLADEQAVKLKNANPTLKMLTSELRRVGFLKK